VIAKDLGILIRDQPNLLGDQPPFAYDEENVPGDKVQFLRNAVLGLKTQENCEHPWPDGTRSHLQFCRQFVQGNFTPGKQCGVLAELFSRDRVSCEAIDGFKSSYFIE